MSTPEEPRYGTGYGGARYPLPPGQDQQPTQQAPAPQGGYPYGQYSPYGPYTPPAPGLGGVQPPPSRPGIVILGLVLVVLSALPYLAFGVLFLVAPLGPDLIPPDTLDNPQFRELGVTDFDVLVTAFRVGAGIVAGLALVYLLFAVIAFTGRNWARILVAVMTAGFAAFALLGVVSALGADPAGAAILIGPVVLAVVGVVTWFAPQANRWYAKR